jgi:hypothetical protein
MNEQQIQKIAKLVACCQQHQLTAAGSTKQAQAQAQAQANVPDDWESHIDRLTQSGGPVQAQALPPWVFQLILQALQTLLQNIHVNPNPNPTPTLATQQGNG